MNNNLSRFADSKVYFQCPICTKSMDIQGNSLICRHGHCFDISRYGYVNLLLKSSPKTNYSKRSFDNRHQILEYGMYDVVLEKIIQFISDTPSIRNILDVGCGEGFYARQIQQRTERNLKNPDYSNESVVEYFEKYLKTISRETVSATVQLSSEQRMSFIEMTPLLFCVEKDCVDWRTLTHLTIEADVLIGMYLRAY